MTPPTPVRSALAVRALAALLAGALAAFATPPLSADDAALGRVPLPPGARSAAIDAGIVQNGYALSVATLDSPMPLEETLAFYRERWASAAGSALPDGHPGFMEGEAGGWHVVSRLEGGMHLAVQLRDGGDRGAEGFVSALPLDAESVAPAPPMPAGGELLSVTASVDDGRRALTSVTSIAARVGEVTATYRDRLVRDGWTLASERDAGAARVLRFARRGARIEVVVTDAGQGTSVVVVNEVADAR